MIILKNAFILLFTIGFMEGFSWFIHKYLFHGPLWFIHKTHHRGGNQLIEWNDLFSLLFGAISVYLLLMYPSSAPLFWVGAGISVYGIIYFIFHDWFIHNRLKPFRTTNRYLLNLRRAHKIHHRSLERTGSSEFGLLIASRNYFKKM